MAEIVYLQAESFARGERGDGRDHGDPNCDGADPDGNIFRPRRSHDGEQSRQQSCDRRSDVLGNRHGGHANAGLEKLGIERREGGVVSLIGSPHISKDISTARGTLWILMAYR